MQIKGINFGGWLLMEGYILGGRNIRESDFKEQFAKIYGRDELEIFEDAFRNNFINKIDFKNIKEIGFNTVRIPFHYKILNNKKLKYLKNALDLASQCEIKVILDLHAAPGAQNQDWHSDSIGEAKLWQKSTYKKKVIKIWEEITSLFKEHEALLGYDVLNEPVINKKQNVNVVKELYKQIVKAIKAIDNKHIIFLEGDIWAQRIDFLKDLIEENIQISIHTYQPLEYTFNFIPFYKYPGKISGTYWDRFRIEQYLEPYFKFSSENKVKIYVGEFGINWRGSFWGEDKWLSDILEVFKKFGFGWTYWTYKAVAQNCFPDGLYQYIPNSRFIKREGPIFGWENYLSLWKKEKKAIIDFWHTKNFTPNAQLIQVLKKFLK
ncbi:MAG: glycoside hydrolase family 5 protein [Candidatus Omnitrophica bacterium]|nr:glycoside hydrolase family 5 protein [Candidatus Omnitrophota bacterium]